MKKVQSKATKYPDIGIMVRVFANGPGDLGSIPGRVIPKTQKMVLDAILLNTQHYKVLSRVKWSNPGKGVAPSPTPWCSSNRKGILRVTFDYGCQIYFYFIFIYIYIYLYIYILSSTDSFPFNQIYIYTYIYIYIYIYIYCHLQTVLLYHNTSVWLDTRDVSSWD